MNTESIEIDMADGTAEAHVVRPGDGDYPGVLLFMDAFGLRPRIDEMAERIAGWGYVVLAPNLFYRSGTVADLAPTVDLRVPENRAHVIRGAMVRVGSLKATAMADTASYLSALQQLPDVSGETVGTTGYCMGGRLSFLAACAFPEVIAAAGCFHAGGLVNDADDSPHLRVAQAAAELYFGHAERDHSMPSAAIAALEAELAGTSLTYTSTVYEGAEHGYTMADTSSYDHDSDERHFEALQGLLARNL